MSANDDIVDILQDALSRLGTVTGRRMFGGVGVYFDGIFFAIIDDGTVYFRTSDTTRAKFEAESSRPFTYGTKNGPVAIASYWRLPERLLDDSDELRDWAESAITAARDAVTAKEKKQRATTAGRRSKTAPKRTRAKSA